MMGFGTLGEYSLGQVTGIVLWLERDEDSESWTEKTRQAETWVEVTRQAETWTET
jgi:hypothetical protein